MLRYRRYRVFVAFAVITLFALYKFGTTNTSSWRHGSSTTDQVRGEPAGLQQPVLNQKPRPEVALETKKLQINVPLAKTSQASQTPPPIAPVSRPVEKPTPAPVPAEKPAVIPKPIGAGGPKPGLPINAPIEDSSSYEPHWQKASEYFPVPSASLIKLPTGPAKSIPTIQAAFKKESDSAKADRLAKLDTIKKVFKRSWDGYKKFAWLHDELKPESGKFRDPFAGWGATLVDALDTLWIMGMKEEFEEAAKAVDKIDFTTTQRRDIPLFETTIRYLGGLLAAYDLSDKVHKNLLEKAVELAEILLSAFDTPNRMPETYYYWQPDRTGPRRASSGVVLAEIGSLSVEFTRLAQLTGEQKYYDAIARITDNFEAFQKETRLPGMWPTNFDASGCDRIIYSEDGKPIPKPPKSPVHKPAQKPIENEDLPLPVSAPTDPEKLSPAGNKYIPLEKPSPIVFEAVSAVAKADETEMKIQEKGTSTLQKRQLDLEEAAIPAASPTARKECEEQGFVAASDFGTEEYTLGGMSDSTYEYLPKEWLLLGGRVEKYQTMYEQAMEVVKKNLIFRPMLPKEEDILFSGKLSVPSPEYENPVNNLMGENAHLTCFAGGMFGMGAKIFNRPEDLEIAKKLTHGCVWSYNMTTTGIMPEGFLTIPCKSTQDCAWNETQYHLAIDSGADARLQSYEQQMETYEIQLAKESALYESAMVEYMAAIKTRAPEPALVKPEATPSPLAGGHGLGKRTIDLEKMEAAVEGDVNTVPEQKFPQRAPIPPRPHANLMVEGETEDTETKQSDEIEDLLQEGESDMPPTPVQAEFDASPEPIPTMPVMPAVYSPRPPLTHKEAVQVRIQEERLPPGVTTIQARNYILRPEAIESVWYMYRITGDQYWREAGWKMFQAVDSHTATVYGNSAIDDVTKASPELNDEMESFWLAETLKYFYLLFTDENVVSLDEWVLNTEAHPLRRGGGA